MTNIRIADESLTICKENDPILMIDTSRWYRKKKNLEIISNLIAGGKKCLKLAKSQAGSIQGKFIRKAFVPTK